jgi:hypothetical protein
MDAEAGREYMKLLVPSQTKMAPQQVSILLILKIVRSLSQYTRHSFSYFVPAVSQNNDIQNLTDEKLSR